METLNDIIDVIVVAGGLGSRMSEISSKYGCKSLVHLNGRPCIDYVIASIRRVLPSSRIILCIDSEELIKKFKQLIQLKEIANIKIYFDKHRGPVQAIYEASSLCNSKKVLVFFGNQLVTPSHIKKILAFNDNSVVLSTFSTTSECHSKIAEIDNNSKILSVSRHNEVRNLLGNERYIDVPYCVPLNFFSMETFPTLKRLFVKAPMEKTTLYEEELVYSVDTDSPPEFHFVREIQEIEEFIKKLIG